MRAEKRKITRSMRIDMCVQVYIYITIVKNYITIEYRTFKSVVYQKYGT